MSITLDQKYSLYLFNEKKNPVTKITYVEKSFKECIKLIGLTEKSDEIRLNAFRYITIWNVLKYVGKEDRIKHLKSKAPFKEQIRAVFDGLLSTEKINYIRQYIGNSIVHPYETMNYDNIYFFDSFEGIYFLPKKMTFDSAEYKIYLQYREYILTEKVALRDTARLYQSVKDDKKFALLEKLLRSTSLKVLKQVHDDLSDLHKQEAVARRNASYKEPYPEPKFNDTSKYFKRLINREQLLAEGMRMRHCVSSYHSNCKRGTSVIYSVILGKDSGTLELSRNGTPLQFSGRRNNSPSTKLRQLAEDFYKQCKKKPKDVKDNGSA